MTDNYNPNPLKNVSFTEACYIHDKSPIDSELWRNSGYRMSAIQQLVMSEQKLQNYKLKQK